MIHELRYWAKFGGYKRLLNELTRGVQARLILILEIFQAVGSREHEGNDINVHVFSRKIWPKLYTSLVFWKQKHGELAESLDVVMWGLAGKKNLSRGDVRRVVSAAKRAPGQMEIVQGLAVVNTLVSTSRAAMVHRMCIGCIIENPYVLFFSAWKPIIRKPNQTSFDLCFK